MLSQLCPGDQVQSESGSNQKQIYSHPNKDQNKESSPQFKTNFGLNFGFIRPATFCLKAQEAFFCCGGTKSKDVASGEQVGQLPQKKFTLPPQVIPVELHF